MLKNFKDKIELFLNVILFIRYFLYQYPLFQFSVSKEEEEEAIYIVEDCDLSRIFSLGDYNSALVIAFLLKKIFQILPIHDQGSKTSGFSNFKL